MAVEPLDPESIDGLLFAGWRQENCPWCGTSKAVFIGGEPEGETVWRCYICGAFTLTRDAAERLAEWQASDAHGASLCCGRMRDLLIESDVGPFIDGEVLLQVKNGIAAF